MPAFDLHPMLLAESVPVTMLELCEVRLQTDANFPWLMLVPQRLDVREIHRLSTDDQHLLAQETSFVAERFEALTGADKMNVAALGNLVPQLHVHVIARFEGDLAWPNPIWGSVARKPYGADELEGMVAKIKEVLT